MFFFHSDSFPSLISIAILLASVGSGIGAAIYVHRRAPKTPNAEDLRVMSIKEARIIRQLMPTFSFFFAATVPWIAWPIIINSYGRKKGTDN